MAFVVKELPVYPPDKMQTALDDISAAYPGALLVWSDVAAPVNRQYAPIREIKEDDGSGGFKTTMIPYAVFVFSTS